MSDPESPSIADAETASNARATPLPLEWNGEALVPADAITNRTLRNFDSHRWHGRKGSDHFFTRDHSS